MAEKKKLAILCDYGLDDLAATAYILERAEHFEKIDILAVGGNFPLDVTFLNAKRIIDSLDAPPKNLRLIDTSSVYQFGEDIPHIHGADGMGNVLPSPDENIHEKIIALPYEEWLESLDDNYILLSLGPCTVTADILKRKGSLPLVLMAGNIAEEPNFNGYEFNHALDIPAFAECVKYPHAAATLDTCHAPLCDFYKLSVDGDSLLHRAARRAVELARSRKNSSCPVYDLVAAVYLFHPERFALELLTDKDGNKVNVLKYISELPLI